MSHQNAGENLHHNHSHGHGHVAETEHRIMNHLMHHHSQSEIYKELHHLRAEDAKSGRNFHKDLQMLNHQLHGDLVKHHLPSLTIEEHGNGFKMHHSSEHHSAQLPHAVRHAISHYEHQKHHPHGQGHFVRPEMGAPDDNSPAPKGDVQPGDASPSKTGFAEKLLTKLGLPVTEENKKFLDAWQKAEGGSADNPFNTTQSMPGARRFNGAGVKRYDSVDTGVEATAKTLTNGYYNEILNAMREGHNAHKAAVAVSHTPWGTRNGVARLV